MTAFHLIRLLGLLCLITGGSISTPLPLLASDIIAPRDRPYVAGGTVVTDRGTLLRGCRHGGNEPVSQEYLALIRQRGLNALHVYGEDYRFEAGERQELIDALVAGTRDAGLYLVLTIGNWKKNGQFELEDVLDFWKFYAPRYADEAHVLYEIQNEPFKWQAPYDARTRDMQLQAYQLIRQHAPHTHVMLFSYAHGTRYSVPYVIEDAQALGDTIDWSNASIAFHAYRMDGREVEDWVRVVKSAGYPVFCTEWEYTDPVSMTDTQALENARVSWVNFTRPRHVADPALFKATVESSGTGWIPDYGDWPGLPRPPLGKRITLRATDGHYLAHYRPRAPRLAADRGQIGTTEIYTVVPAEKNDHIHLRGENGQYVRLNIETGELLCDGEVQDAITFQWVARPDGTISLESAQGTLTATGPGAYAELTAEPVPAHSHFTWMVVDLPLVKKQL